jgi:hypothetical protein
MRHGIPPSSMELEITESLLLNIAGQVNPHKASRAYGLMLGFNLY